MAFHARGLLNTKVIQNNLDWVWPYWVEKQFDPRDPSFIPRAFSFSHVNLTHRDWTAVGKPDDDQYAIVDPRGLLTPFTDSWSIDAWILTEDETEHIFPSRLKQDFQQYQNGHNNLVVSSRISIKPVEFKSEVHSESNTTTIWDIEVQPHKEQAWLALALRPYNPEGIQLIDTIEWSEPQWEFTVNNDARITLNKPPERVVMSNYEDGDVAQGILKRSAAEHIHCSTGLATAAALYPLSKDEPLKLQIQVSPQEPKSTEASHRIASNEEKSAATRDWESLLQHTAKLDIPDTRYQYLFDNALKTLILLSPHTCYPGPYTYRRFWFRDACLMMHSLLAANLPERVERIHKEFFQHQNHKGYFHSQEGEWDSNGQVLWISDLLFAADSRLPSPDQLTALRRAGDWIINKRHSTQARTDEPHHGLFPPGFSAEHFGPNDYYYWDDMWGAAGLRALARILVRSDLDEEADHYHKEAEAFENDILKSLEHVAHRRGHPAIPASPFRRMDSAAVGALVVDYPLHQNYIDDQVIEATIQHLRDKHLVRGVFFQDMIHSGLNAYLSLAIAQSLLKRGRPEAWEMMDAVADIASPTGHWPEAVHPQSGGGCMGDGQHGWAAAEWLMAMRNLFIIETNDELILGQGIKPEWFQETNHIGFGPTTTRWGPLTLKLQCEPGSANWTLRLETQPQTRVLPKTTVRIPGFSEFRIQHPDWSYPLKPLKE